MIEYILLMIIGMILSLVIYATRYKKVSPNQAMVIYGRRTIEGIGYKVISGGGTFIIPIFEKYEYLELGPYNVEHLVEDARTSAKERVRIKFTGIIRISSKAEILKQAAEHMIGKSREEIITFGKTIIEGSILRVARTMSYNQMDDDLSAFIAQVMEDANHELNEIGLDSVSLTINELKAKG